MLKKHLKIGRVYNITPDPIPPYKIKSREAVYVGKIIFERKNMPLFIQIGSTEYNDLDLIKYNKKIRYFWKQMNRDGYFHIAVSKPEYLRTINNIYKKNQKYVDLKKKDAKKLNKIWFNKIQKLKKDRWKKAYYYFRINKKEVSIKQLNLLKYTMPWKYKNIKPIEIIDKWKQKNK